MPSGWNRLPGKAVSAVLGAAGVNLHPTCRNSAEGRLEGCQGPLHGEPQTLGLGPLACFLLCDSGKPARSGKQPP